MRVVEAIPALGETLLPRAVGIRREIRVLNNERIVFPMPARGARLQMNVGGGSRAPATPAP